MTREEYIQKLLAIYKLKYQPSELELREFELLLQMIPDSDKSTLTLPTSPLTIPDATPSNPNPWWRDQVLIYGPPIPRTIEQFYNTSTTTDQNVTTQYTEVHGLDKGTEEH